MNAYSGSIVAIVALALLWLGIAAAIAFVAARRFRLARAGARRGAVERDFARADSGAAAGRPGRRPHRSRCAAGARAGAEVAAEPACANWPVTTAGLSPTISKALTEEIEAARVSAGRISRKVRAKALAGCSTCAAGRRRRQNPRAQCCSGSSIPAPARRSARSSRSRLRQTEGALNSLTHLIEAAPFPMWYRGPDLKLGLVNSAFVDAVEGRRRRRRDRALPELIDAEGEDSAIATRPQGAGERAASSRACSRRSSAASGACCGSSTCRCRPARSPASRSTSRTSRTRGPSLRATSNRSASSPTE